MILSHFVSSIVQYCSILYNVVLNIVFSIAIYCNLYCNLYCSLYCCISLGMVQFCSVHFFMAVLKMALVLSALAAKSAFTVCLGEFFLLMQSQRFLVDPIMMPGCSRHHILCKFLQPFSALECGAHFHTPQPLPCSTESWVGDH